MLNKNQRALYSTAHFSQEWIDALASDDGRSEGDAVMVHKSIIRGYHVYKEVWKPKIGIGSTASIKAGKYVCAYEKMCTYKKGALNNPSLRYLVITDFNF